MRNLEHSKRVSEANNSCGLYEFFYPSEIKIKSAAQSEIHH